MSKDFWGGVFATLFIIAFMAMMYVAFNRNEAYQLAADTRHSAGAAQQHEHRLSEKEGKVSQEGY